VPRLPSPEDLADFILLISRKQIRQADRFDALATMFTGKNTIEPFNGVLVGGSRQDIRAAVAYVLAQWLSEKRNQQSLMDLGIKLAPLEFEGIAEILRGGKANKVIYRTYFEQDRKTVEDSRDRVARGIAQVLVAVQPERFARDTDDVAASPTSRDHAAVEDHLAALVGYCRSLPRWFPAHLQFTEIQQEVLVRPPSVEASLADHDRDDADHDRDERASHVAKEIDSDSRSRPLPLGAALQRYPSVLLLGRPGSGKSWAAKGRCLSLAEGRTHGTSVVVPILVVAARLEEQLASLGQTASVDLPRVLAESMPEELVVRQGAVELVADLLRTGTQVELLIDGYDEVGDERPHLDRHLASIVRLLVASDSRFVMTSRPTSVPPQRVAKLMATMALQAFSEREQLAFVDTWFEGTPDRGEQVKRWVANRRLDLLKTPLLIALLCAVTSHPVDVPPESEPELMYRVLTRLARDEERFDEVEANSELVRLRIAALEQLALSFVTNHRIEESMSGTALEDQHHASPHWKALRKRTARASVIDDLASTGLLQQSLRGQDVEARFLHNEIRDYLIARALKRTATWRTYVPRIWAQPQWESPIAYAAAVLEDPDELLLALERRFDLDPLNTARFVAGRAITLAGQRLSKERRRRTRDELFIILGSNDAIDRGRAAELLASFHDDDETAAMVRSLINPAVPPRVVEAALRSVAGGDSQASVQVLASCAVDARFTDSEREAAVESLAGVASADALTKLEDIARDPDGDGGVRALAAFESLRRLSEDRVARELLKSMDADSRDARWGLAERIGGQRPSVEEFVDGILSDESAIPDPYCRALVASSGAAISAAKFTLAPAIPINPALDLMTSAVESARTRSEGDPLAVVGARFLLDQRQNDALRWLVATKLAHADDTGAIDFWSNLVREVPAHAKVALVSFLRSEVDALPAALSSELHVAMTSGRLGAIAQEEAARPNDEGETRADQSDAEGQAESLKEEDLPALADVLSDPTQGGMTQYQQLRVLRRAIPTDGRLLQSASSLTHAVTAVGSTAWIDAQPVVANALEDRLLRSKHQEARNELVKLRATWPMRQEEVPDSAESYHSSVLESRAWAALLEENPVEAASMALASIGAETATGRPPTEFTSRVLFGAGTLAGRDTFEQVRNFLPVFDENGSSAILLRGWLMAAVNPPDNLADHLSTFTPRTFPSEAEFVALRCIAGLGGPEDFNEVNSWSACLTAGRFLQAIALIRREGPVRDRAAAASAAAANRATMLAPGWPPPGPRSPSELGHPRWQRKLVDIAFELLSQDMAPGAVVVFKAALEERPNSANLINNLGFSLVPVDKVEALELLDRAAALYPRPFAVNVANRMLLRFHRGDSDDYVEVLRIAEEYKTFAIIGSESSGVFLWDIDDPATLTKFSDAYHYIAELAQRAATAIGESELAQHWRTWEDEMTRALSLQPPQNDEPASDSHD
jgi:hypothetical protein